MEKVIMKCGHRPQGIVSGTNEPVCVICSCTEVAKEVPNLEGRKARCSYYDKTFTYRGRRVHCRGEAKSDTNLPFFEHKPSSEYDEYYCGCWGWD